MYRPENGKRKAETRRGKVFSMLLKPFDFGPIFAESRLESALLADELARVLPDKMRQMLREAPVLPVESPNSAASLLELSRRPSFSVSWSWSGCETVPYIFCIPETYFLCFSLSDKSGGGGG